MSYNRAATVRFFMVAAIPLIWGSLSSRAGAQQFLHSGHAQESGYPEALSDWDGRLRVLESSRESVQSDREIAASLKELLTVGVDTVVAKLGSNDGFKGDPQARIALPAPLGKMQSTLQRVGFGSQMEHLQMRLNMAAEASVLQAHEVFLEAVSELNFLDDVRRICLGPDDAATQYLRALTSEWLSVKLQPIVKENLEKVGAPQALARVVDQYHALPLSTEVDSDLTGYVVERTLQSVFYYLALEESSIRRNPDNTVSESLQCLFEE